MKIHFLTHDDACWNSVADFASTCSWDACARMAAFMRNNSLKDWERVIVAENDGGYMGFCVLLKPGSFPGFEYTPLIKWVFVKEQYRGRRLSQSLLEAVAEYAKGLGFNKVFLTTWHVGLYEKYGFVKIFDKEVRDGYVEGVYEKSI